MRQKNGFSDILMRMLVKLSSDVSDFVFAEPGVVRSLRPPDVRWRKPAEGLPRIRRV